MVVAKRPPETVEPEAEFGKRSGTFAAAGAHASATRPHPDERSLDDYDPQEDTVPPLSVRSSHMELLWICGDCGEHYPRAQACPDECGACGAPKQNFYAHVED